MIEKRLKELEKIIKNDPADLCDDDKIEMILEIRRLRNGIKQHKKEFHIDLNEPNDQVNFNVNVKLWKLVEKK